MQTITVPRNDKGYTLDITVLKSDGSAEVLTPYTPVLKAWAPTSPSKLIINGTCVNDDSITNLCRWTITPQTAVGTYYAEIELTVGSAVVRSSQLFRLVIGESG